MLRWRNGHSNMSLSSRPCPHTAFIAISVRCRGEGRRGGAGGGGGSSDTTPLVSRTPADRRPRAPARAADAGRRAPPRQHHQLRALRVHDHRGGRQDHGRGADRQHHQQHPRQPLDVEVRVRRHAEAHADARRGNQRRVRGPRQRREAPRHHQLREARDHAGGAHEVPRGADATGAEAAVRHQDHHRGAPDPDRAAEQPAAQPGHQDAQRPPPVPGGVLDRLR